MKVQKAQDLLSSLDFDSLFFHKGQAGLDAFEEAVNRTKALLLSEEETHVTPYSGETPLEVATRIDGLKVASEKGEGLEEILRDLQQRVFHPSVRVTHPTCIGHLHCPPLIASVIADLIIGVLNPSMDSWDQSPSATYVEQQLIQWICQQFKYPSSSDGVFTSGGTQSNYMALMLARDAFCLRELQWEVRRHGLPQQAKRMRILCSEYAHFTVQQAAVQLGLGEQSVIPVATNEKFQLDPCDLKDKLSTMKALKLLPFAIVATCGTTDFGSIDPLTELAEIATQHQLWLHVDAAYGGALVLSQRNQDKLKGIELADSITVDFHKLFYQTISCGAFLVKEKACFRLIERHASYLNPKEDEDEGVLNLVGKSLQTTRRFDALKILLSMRWVGTERFARMIDYTIDLAQGVVELMKGFPSLQVLNPHPEISAVVFRYVSQRHDEERDNQMNRRIQQMLLKQGHGLVAKTVVKGKVYLKLTLLNPRTTLSDIEKLCQKIIALGMRYTQMDMEVM
ncbi:L-2,4-diaminobutyrate decarboxylase [Pullulanibacillus camelliae]|uniref:L-2,4-diaminobutyrate decarboxylase n=1 Tax=Pullulanibacillus camelliae TaxID=1707096 RepID=A0A8J2VMD5_9BACL|nr:aspartate aminotransferase family protein [Pullulanibacillus camelliae]GGE30175.1 L-2,4-diaminobutyrate decarboxylase [Pullulanibacillus camelliae]